MRFSRNEHILHCTYNESPPHPVKMMAEALIWPANLVLSVVHLGFLETCPNVDKYSDMWSLVDIFE